jgi:hypothetical protein
MKQQLNEVKRMQELAGVVENEVNSIDNPNIFDDVPSVRINIDDTQGRDIMFVDISTFFHDEGDGKIALLKGNEALQELLMKVLQVEFQKAYRKAVHSVTGIPFGIK